jgi:2-keto-3-deoxy-L-rhamnonate aldolase RhmA
MSAPAGFRAKVLSGAWLAGTFINLGSALTAEIAANAGFDWLMIDQEHGPGGEETLLSQLQAVTGTGVSPVVRIAANEEPRFKRVLDLGASGVMVPHVNSAEEAARAVASVRYPPWGHRGVSRLNRAAGFGTNFDSYYATAHLITATIVQIETLEALKQVEAIAGVDGVDALFVGPLDLSTNMGIPGQFEHPRMLEARRSVAKAARNHGKAAGLLLGAPSQIAAAREDGFSLVALGSDGGAVTTGLRQTAAALKA